MGGFLIGVGVGIIAAAFIILLWCCLKAGSNADDEAGYD